MKILNIKFEIQWKAVRIFYYNYFCDMCHRKGGENEFKLPDCEIQTVVGCRDVHCGYKNIIELQAPLTLYLSIECCLCISVFLFHHNFNFKSCLTFFPLPYDFKEAQKRVNVALCRHDVYLPPCLRIKVTLKQYRPTCWI